MKPAKSGDVARVGAFVKVGQRKPVWMAFCWTCGGKVNKKGKRTVCVRVGPFERWYCGRCNPKQLTLKGVT